MITVLAVHFAVAAVAPLLFRRFGRNSFYALAAVPAASFIWLILQHGAVYPDTGTLHAAGTAEVLPWIPGLQLELAFRMDALAWVMSLLILGVGALVLVYCARYFKDKDEYLGGFGAQLLAFAGAMFGLVAADDLLLMFVFWELTTVLSYLLIGYARTRLSARRSALQALMVTTAGGLAMLVGLIMLGVSAGTYRISAILEQAPALVTGPDGAAVGAAVVLILIGAITKSALVPFHFWLPGAMAAPTPVSAYLHAAAMVKAGIYLVARLAPGFAETAFWLPVVLGLGLATMLVGGYRALRQTDIKLILAYGTVSQLGFLTMVVGLGKPDAALAGLALLLAHGLFKGTLFLVVGIIDHQAGTRDIRKLSGVYGSARALAVVAAIGAASMAGIPPLAGFVAKESVFEAFVHYGSGPAAGPWGPVLLTGLVLGSILTFAYSARFMWGAFAVKPGVETTPFKPIKPAFLAAPAVLSLLTIVYGVWPDPVDGWIQPYAALFPGGPADDAGSAAGAVGAAGHLSLWHGFTPALALTAITFALGLAMFYGRNAVSRLQSLVPGWIDGDRSYQSAVGALDDAAVWVTGRTQRGSLFFYLSVILTVAFVLPLTALLMAGKPLPGDLYFIDPNSPLQLVVGTGIVIGALAAVRANKRFLAVLMVSVTGYGIALMFALQGAPDLALTQMLVETIILVAFVLAMRSLPAELRDRTGGKYRVIRVIIGAAFGITMVFVAIYALGARVAEPVSLEFPRLAYEGGGGLNIVNVTLVDIRAWDTFGEISVLALAATGVASLIFVRGRGDGLRPASTVAEGTVGRRKPGRGAGRGNTRDDAALAMSRRFAASSRDEWLVAGRTLAPERRSIIFEVVTRMIFHSMIVFSVYLLLAGHNLPGGGFAGGLTAGLALTMRYLAGGRYELREATPVSAGALLGIGLATAAASGVAPLLLGGQVFQSAIIELWLPVFGDIKFVTSTLFDIGVYTVVVGLALDVLRSLGAEIDEHFEEHPAEPSDDQEAGGAPDQAAAEATARGRA
ncbi:Na+/H+ antiporter subunit A [Pseudarthrobacter sp. O4]|uniref:Na+/H+ antiporter subunit A n=1 Tax=Pseudarthrobacter sp. O4 TaxID=3418417 RepID=UPI003CF7195F